MCVCVCVCVCVFSGGQCRSRDDHRSTQCLYMSAENQRPPCHALVQRRYGNATTLSSADDKFRTLPTQRGSAANATQHSTASSDRRSLRAQLVASADCIYCRYGSVDACKQTTTSDVVACRRASDAEMCTESLQHSPLTA